MKITKLSIKNFRNFAIGDFTFNDKTYITGRNGTGKTSVLESIYYLSSFKSFRASSESKVVRIGEKEFIVNADGIREEESFNIGLMYSNNKKQMSVNQERVDKLTDGFGIFLSVILSIYDKLLSHQSSIYRRKFFDRIISTVDNEYFENLIEYHSILKRKNMILKTSRDRALLDVYSHQMSQRSEYIYQRRIEFSEYFCETLTMLYGEIFSRNPNITVNYISSKDGGNYIESSLEEIFKKNREKEILRQRVIYGPHLDDYDIEVDNKPISQFGSEGEKELLGVTLKTAEIKLIYENRGEYPVVLIDDAFSEIDSQNRKMLMGIFDKYPQVILTSPEKAGNILDYSIIDLDSKAV